MMIYDEDSYWTVLLLLCDKNRENFLVLPNKNKDANQNERWVIPNMEKGGLRIEPETMILWIASGYFELNSDAFKTKYLCSSTDRIGNPVYVFTNREYTEEIGELFEKQADKGGGYQIMPFARAGLTYSGLDYLHRGILSEDAKLINTACSSQQGPQFRCAYVNGLAGKILGFSPKPL